MTTRKKLSTWWSRRWRDVAKGAAIIVGAAAVGVIVYAAAGASVHQGDCRKFCRWQGSLYVSNSWIDDTCECITGEVTTYHLRTYDEGRARLEIAP